MKPNLQPEIADMSAAPVLSPLPYDEDQAAVGDLHRPKINRAPLRHVTPVNSIVEEVFASAPKRGMVGTRTEKWNFKFAIIVMVLVAAINLSLAVLFDPNGNSTTYPDTQDQGIKTATAWERYVKRNNPVAAVEPPATNAAPSTSAEMEEKARLLEILNK